MAAALCAGSGENSALPIFNDDDDEEEEEDRELAMVGGILLPTDVRRDVNGNLAPVPLRYSPRGAD